MTQTLSYTPYGTPTSKARAALAKALASELELPAAALPYLARAGEGEQAGAYVRAAERVLDELAGHAAMQVSALARERDRLVRGAQEREQDEQASAQRVSHLTRAVA